MGRSLAELRRSPRYRNGRAPALSVRHAGTASPLCCLTHASPSWTTTATLRGVGIEEEAGAPDWIADWLDGEVEALSPETLRELTTFGDDARRLGLLPALVGPHDDPVFALVHPGNERWPTHSWEIRLRLYDLNRYGRSLGEWLVDNVGNAARMGPSYVVPRREPSADGVVHIEVVPFSDDWLRTLL